MLDMTTVYSQRNGLSEIQLSQVGSTKSKILNYAKESSSGCKFCHKRSCMAITKAVPPVSVRY